MRRQLQHALRRVREATYLPRMIWYGIGNLCYWFRVIWNDRFWDWTFLYVILEHKLRRMERDFRRYGVSANAEKDARWMRICAELCRRATKEWRYDTPSLGPWLRSWRWRPGQHLNKKLELYDDYMVKQDITYLHSILTKKVRGWWD